MIVRLTRPISKEQYLDELEVSKISPYFINKFLAEGRSIYVISQDGSWQVTREDISKFKAEMMLKGLWPG